MRKLLTTVFTIDTLTEAALSGITPALLPALRTPRAGDGASCAPTP